jgi:hypothetical protein
MILLKCSPVGRATLATRAATLEEALIELPLYMQPFPGEAVTYLLIDDEPNPYHALPATALLSYEAARFVTLRAIANGIG